MPDSRAELAGVGPLIEFFTSIFLVASCMNVAACMNLTSIAPLYMRRWMRLSAR
jgi:hypothetical protein